MKKNKNSNSNIHNYKKMYYEYAKVVLLNYIKNYFDLEHSFIPEYLKEELSIGDCDLIVKKLTKKGYIEVCDDGRMEVTQKGESVLKDKGDYIQFFDLALESINFQDYIKIKQTRGNGKDFEEIIATLLLGKLKKFKRQDNFTAVRNTHFELACLYEKASYKEEALYHYTTVLYYDISGLEYYDYFLEHINKKISTEKLTKIYEFTYIDPRVKEALIRLGEFYIDDIVDRIYQENLISINLFTKEEMKRLVRSIIKNEFDNYSWQVCFWEAYKNLINISKDYIKTD